MIIYNSSFSWEAAYLAISEKAGSTLVLSLAEHSKQGMWVFPTSLHQVSTYSNYTYFWSILSHLFPITTKGNESGSEGLP